MVPTLHPSTPVAVVTRAVMCTEEGSDHVCTRHEMLVSIDRAGDSS